MKKHLSTILEIKTFNRWCRGAEQRLQHSPYNYCTIQPSTIPKHPKAVRVALTPYHTEGTCIGETRCGTLKTTPCRPCLRASDIAGAPFLSPTATQLGHTLFRRLLCFLLILYQTQLASLILRQILACGSIHWTQTTKRLCT